MKRCVCVCVCGCGSKSFRHPYDSCKLSDATRQAIPVTRAVKLKHATPPLTFRRVRSDKGTSVCPDAPSTGSGHIWTASYQGEHTVPTSSSSHTRDILMDQGVFSLRTVHVCVCLLSLATRRKLRRTSEDSSAMWHRCCRISCCFNRQDKCSYSRLAFITLSHFCRV